MESCSDGSWGDISFGHNGNKKGKIVSLVIENNMQDEKAYFDSRKKTYNEYKDRKNFKFNFLHNGDGTLNVKESVNYSWAIDENCQTLNIEYEFWNVDYELNNIIPSFQKTKDNGCIKECFGKDFPSMIVYNKLNNRFYLTFSTSDNLPVPTKDEYLQHNLKHLEAWQKAYGEELKTFMKYKDKKILPLWKKKKFLAGKKYYDNTIIIDNNKQDILRKYDDLTHLNIEK